MQIDCVPNRETQSLSELNLSHLLYLILVTCVVCVWTLNVTDGLLVSWVGLVWLCLGFIHVAVGEIVMMNW